MQSLRLVFPVPASVISALCKSVLAKFAMNRFAFCKLAFVRFADVKSAKYKLTLLRFALERSASLRYALNKLELERFVYAKLAYRRSKWFILLPYKFCPDKSIGELNSFVTCLVT